MAAFTQSVCERMYTVHVTKVLVRVSIGCVAVSEVQLTSLPKHLRILVV